MSVGKKSKFAYVDYTVNGTSAIIGPLMNRHYKGYESNRINVIDAINAHNCDYEIDFEYDDPSVEPSMIIGNLTSDGEHAIIKGGLTYIQDKGYTVTRLASKEHVTWVEVKIGVYKRRICGIRISINYKLPFKVFIQLVK